MLASQPDPAALAPSLLAWAGAARRDLPWRRDRTPYKVWVSEVMLQQTQAATVVPYFERWLERFPDISVLAAAPLQDVLKAWEGLGYYARARNLWEAARRVEAEHGGRLPGEREALLALPGIGRYTVGAILSLAFGQHEPVLDGNVRRVLCRLYDIAEDPRLPDVEARLWGLAEAIVRTAPDGQAGDLNEALMELGALVCTPGTPACGACPLRSDCLAFARGSQNDRPARTSRAATPHYDAVAAIIADAGGRYLIGRRPNDGLLGGLWEFPGTRAGIGEAGRQGPGGLAGSLRDAVAKKIGLEVLPHDRPFMTVRHAYTHFRITLHAFMADAVSGEAAPLGYTAVTWVSLAGMAGYPLPVTDQKILAALVARS